MDLFSPLRRNSSRRPHPFCLHPHYLAADSYMAPQHQYTEEDFVKLLQSGAADGFGVLYDRFSGALMGVVMKVIGNRELAEDVLQEAFVKIWDKRSTYDASKGRLYTWMLNITRNTAIDAARNKHIKIASKIRNVEDSVHSINKQSDIRQQEDSIGINELVDMLLPEQKAIVDLMYFGGMTQDEVSQELNLPLGTVKTRARAALMKLREKFKHGVT